jgi:hypothetical protein
MMVLRMKAASILSLLLLVLAGPLHAADFDLTNRMVSHTVRMGLNSGLDRTTLRDCFSNPLSNHCGSGTTVSASGQFGNTTDPFDLVFCPTLGTVITQVGRCGSKGDPTLTAKPPFVENVPCGPEASQRPTFFDSCSSDFNFNQSNLKISSGFGSFSTDGIDFNPIDPRSCSVSGAGLTPYPHCPRADQEMKQTATVFSAVRDFPLAGRGDQVHPLIFSWNGGNACLSTSCSFTDPAVSWTEQLTASAPDGNGAVFGVDPSCPSPDCSFYSSGFPTMIPPPGATPTDPETIP